MFPDVTLHTARCILRPVHPADGADVQDVAADPLTQTWLPLPRPYTRAHAETWCAETVPTIRSSGLGLVRTIEFDGRFAGMINLKRTDWVTGVTEIGYMTSGWARSLGLMTEAVRALAKWVLLEVGLHRVELRIAPGNTASLRVATKAGFVQEGTARSAGYIHDCRVDLVIFSLLPTDLHESPARPAAPMTAGVDARRTELTSD